MGNFDSFFNTLSEEEIENLARGCKTSVLGLVKAVNKYELSIVEIKSIADLITNYQTKIFTVAKLLRKGHSLDTIACTLEVRNDLADERDSNTGRIVFYKPSLETLVEFIDLFHEGSETAEDILGQIEEFGLGNGAKMKTVIRVANEHGVKDIEVATRFAFSGKKRDILNDPLSINDPESEEEDHRFNVVEGNYE